MNLILLFESDFISSDCVRLIDRRFAHVKEILKAQKGKELTVGQVNGLIGRGVVTQLTEESLLMEVAFNQKPPQPMPITLIMPMIRPLMFKRLLLTAASLGIKKIVLLNFNRVEKSLWQSSALAKEAIKEQLVLGLEQARDTHMPEVIIRPRFKPFIEDELPKLAENTFKIVAHPGGEACPYKVDKNVTLVIGPEGGLVDFEVESLKKLGFLQVDLGTRILKVETALPFIMGRIF
ncbi:MAG: 16S rRNA (uracil(1498)-N(3))-methyltransferase [Candidatus Omnitrophota bacterium]